MWCRMSSINSISSMIYLQLVSGSKRQQTRTGIFGNMNLDDEATLEMLAPCSIRDFVLPFGRGKKTFGGNSLWMFPLDQLSKCLANQWEKCRLLHGADQTTNDSRLIVLSFWCGSWTCAILPDELNFFVIDSDGVAKISSMLMFLATIRTPNDIHVRFKVEIGRQNLRECVFWAQLAPQWVGGGSRLGVIEMRNRVLVAVNGGVVSECSVNLHDFAHLGLSVDMIRHELHGDVVGMTQNEETWEPHQWCGQEPLWRHTMPGAFEECFGHVSNHEVYDRAIRMIDAVIFVILCPISCTSCW